MAITEAFTGTETVSTTEWSMTTDTAGPDVETSDGIFQAFIDFNAVAAGDVFEFKCYEKVLSSSTQRLVYSARIAGAQSQPNWVSPTLVLMNGWDMTLIKISGTDRSIDWSIRKVA
jgi:hypothetical protein